MLYVTATNDKGCLNSLYQKIFNADFPGGVGYIMYSDEVPVGVAQMTLNEEEAHIISLGIIPEERKKGYGDFFTRVLMDKVSYVTDWIIIDYTSDYFLKFGFKEENGKMKLLSDDIVFPSSCHHN